MATENLQDEIKEFKEDLSDIDKLFYDTALSTSKLNKGLSSTQKILDSKVWTVVSRVTSGGAFWRFQNRIRAVIETANMLTSLSARKAKREAEMMRETAKLAKQYEKLVKIQSFFEKGAPLDDEMKKKIQETDVYYSNLLKFYRQGLNQEEASKRAMKETLKMIEKRIKNEGVLNKIKKDTAKIPFFERTKTLKTIKSAFSEANKFTKDTTKKFKEAFDVSKALSGGIYRDTRKYRFEMEGDRFRDTETGNLTKVNKLQEMAIDFYEKHPKKIDFLLESSKSIGNLLRPITKAVKTLVFFIATIVGTLILLGTGLGLLYEVSQKYGEEINKGLTTFYSVLEYGFELMGSGLGNIYSGIINLGTGFYDLLNGDFYTGISTILTGGWQILLGAIQILGGLLVATFGAVIAGLITAIKEVALRGSGLVLEKLGHVQVFIGKIILGIALVAAAISLVVAGTIAAPIIIAAAIGAGLILLGSKLIEFGRMIENTILAAMRSIVEKLPSRGDVPLVGGLLEKFASGGVVNSPYQIVGEEGPELVKLPRGSRVYSNNQSKGMMNTGTTNNITVQVTGRVGASDSEIKDIAQKVAKEINTQMNRTTSSVVRFQ